MPEIIGFLPHRDNPDLPFPIVDRRFVSSRRGYRRGQFIVVGLGMLGLGLLAWSLFPDSHQEDGFNIALGKYGVAVVRSTSNLQTIAPQPKTSSLVDASGGIVTRLHGPQDRVPVTLSQIHPYLVQSVLAIEDRGFMDHDGLEPKAIIRAFGVDLAAGKIVQGGSTITQQLVKNAIIGSDRTWQRKIKEASLSLQLESQWSKEQILEEYLNLIYLGAGNYGVGAASSYWFSTTPDALTLPQSALLAGMIAAPTSFDPRENPDGAKTRRNRVLDAMVETKAITRAEADQAKEADLGLAINERASGMDAVTAWIVHRLQHDPAFHTLGDTPADRASRIFGGGLTIHTTIDPRWQQSAEAAVNAQIATGSQAQAAVVAIDPDTGYVKAMVSGSKDPNRPAASLNLAAQAIRQPGSTFKPVVLAAALRSGINLDQSYPAPASITLPDRSNPNGPAWTVNNAGGAAYGALDLRAATAFSVNTVYAQVMNDIGVPAVKQMATDLGITHPLPDSPAIALGAGELTVMDMASVQATLATGGLYHAPTVVSKITDEHGQVVYEGATGKGTRTVEPAVAWATTRAMTAVVDEGTGHAADIGRPFAGKTGTSQNNSDAWFTGFTRDVAVAVWVGDPQAQTPLRPPVTPIEVSGANWPAMIAGQTVSGIERQINLRPFTVPEGERVRVLIDKTRGCLPNPNTPPALLAEIDFPAGQEPTSVCVEPTAPDRITVPNVVGLKADTATQAMEDVGLRVTVTEQANDQVPPGVVWAQTPNPGTQGAPPYSQATLLVSPEKKPTPARTPGN
ncbi:penicillin-binding protein [Stomatohabitans albus]|uniref:penicillin-binding protein n=1 Tax=Stomatohabitans albus TaxID=3110766 RepID=UPI00300CD9C6